MTIVVQSGTLRSPRSYRWVNTTASISTQSRTVSVTPTSAEQLLLIGITWGSTSVTVSSVKANTFDCDLVLSQEYSAGQGGAAFYSIPTSTTGTGSPFNVIFTASANFKALSMTVWALSGLSSLTAKKAINKGSFASVGPITATGGAESGTNVATNDLLFSAFMFSATVSTSLTAANSTEAPASPTGLEHDGTSLLNKYTEQVIQSSHTPFTMRWDWVTNGSKAGAYAVVSYA